MQWDKLVKSWEGLTVCHSRATRPRAAPSATAGCWAPNMAKELVLGLAIGCALGYALGAQHVTLGGVASALVLPALLALGVGAAIFGASFTWDHGKVQP